MKRTFLATRGWVLSAAASLALIASGAMGQGVDLDELMRQMEGEQETVVVPSRPQKALRATDEIQTSGVPDRSIGATTASRDLPSSYDEVAVYAGRFVDHDLDHTGQIMAHVCDLLADVDMKPQNARICVSRTGEF